MIISNRPASSAVCAAATNWGLEEPQSECAEGKAWLRVAKLWGHFWPLYGAQSNGTAFLPTSPLQSRQLLALRNVNPEVGDFTQTFVGRYFVASSQM